jgi:hypothetical protein
MIAKVLRPEAFNNMQHAAILFDVRSIRKAQFVQEVLKPLAVSSRGTVQYAPKTEDYWSSCQLLGSR